MAITPTLRFLLKQYGSGGDPHPNRAEFNAMIDAIENNAAMFSQGITGARPAAGKRGRFYYDETVDRLYYDNGAAWKDANPNGGGGAGRALAIGAVGGEGTSARAARADHTHPLPLAAADAPGAMSAADKAKLDAATDAATAGAIARRDTSGRIAVATPTAGGHATTKTYVDGLIQDTANFSEGLVDSVRYVCTSTTRPAAGLRYDGQEIFETDTRRTRIWDEAKGLWECVRQSHTLFTPVWRGFDNLGAGYTSGGSYAVIGPRLIRANMWLKGGTGAYQGKGRVAVTLPFRSAGYPQQFGMGSQLVTGPDGPLRAIFGAMGGSSDAIEMWSWPDIQNATAAMFVPGYFDYPFVKGSEIHMNVTYEAEAF
jgi:hypothetical protein